MCDKDLDKCVEETVEEMRKKIDEISKNADELNDEELKKEAGSIKDKIVPVIEDAIKKIQELAKDIQDNETFEKFLDLVKTKSKDLFDSGLKLINDLKNNDKLKDTVDDVFSKTVRTGEKIAENDEVKKVFDTILKTFDNAKKQVNDFLTKPEVKDTVDKVKDFGLDVAGKAVDSIKEIFKEDEDKGGN